MSTSTRLIATAGLTHHSAKQSPLPRLDLMSLFRQWLRRREENRYLIEMDERMAKDIGISPAGRGWPDAFAVDPRPLWGIGLTPAPASEGRGGHDAGRRSVQPEAIRRR